MRDSFLEYNKSLEDLQKSISSEYGFNKEVSQKIVSKADIDYHSCSFNEVRDAAYELAEWLKEVIVKMDNKQK